MSIKGSPPKKLPSTPKRRPGRKRLYLTEDDLIPDVESAVRMLECLGSDCDPVEVKLDNGKYMEFANGLNEFDCGGVIRMPTLHVNCPSCDCTIDVDGSGSSDKFLIRYASMDRGMVEGTIWDMVLDRMGIQKG